MTMRITPVALVQTPGGYRMRARYGDQIIQFPLDLLHRPNNPHGLRDFLAKQHGIMVDKVNGPALKQAARSLPVIHGTPCLGWTPDRDAFLYGKTVLYTSKQPGQRHEYMGVPLLPRGSWEVQFEGLVELWARVPLARLVLSLSTASPFLEPLAAPSHSLHVHGPTGIGKTSTLRAVGIAPFADPRLPLFGADLSQDTDNYVDTRLGTVHNFPILLDETTLRDPAVMAATAYRIVSGRTKGRLTGPEREYAPAPTSPYTLVCLLSGEDPIRSRIGKRGAAARFMEMAITDPLLPREELSAWWSFAEEHHGWYGRLLVPWAIAMYFSLGRNGEPLRELYAGARDGIASWCSGHSRLFDFLAAVHVGYVLAVHVLHIGVVGAISREIKGRIAAEAEAFTHEVYGWLETRTQIDDVLDAIAGVTGIGTWVERGFIPTSALEPIAREFGLEKPRGALLGLLRHHGIVSGVESRKVEDSQVGPLQVRRSERCFLLTPAGKRRLGLQNDHAWTTD